MQSALKLEPPSPPREKHRPEELDANLVRFAFPNTRFTWSTMALLQSLPPALSSILHEDYLLTLSRTFSDSSHDGPVDVALRSGRVLLSLYLVLYPPRYPQIGKQLIGRDRMVGLSTLVVGMHCIELAKVIWNASVTEDQSHCLADARQYLEMAEESLLVLGPDDGAEEGPWKEMVLLKDLLRSVGY